MYLLSLSEFTATTHCWLLSVLRCSTMYITFDASGSETELHTRETELCVVAVATRSSGGSVGSGVGVVVGGGVVVMMTSENNSINLLLRNKLTVAS